MRSSIAHPFRSAKSISGRTSGYSLVEILIAMSILLLLTVVVITSLTYTSQISRLNANRSAAKNIAQGLIEQMNSEVFARVGPVAEGGVYETENIWLDEAREIPCEVSYTFKGYGQATGGSSNTLTDAGAGWEANEWQGDTVYIVAGTGRGQYAQITSNTADRLTFASSMAFSLDATSRYMINNGKTVEVTTQWQFLDREYEQSMETLIINWRNDDTLGFAGI